MRGMNMLQMLGGVAVAGAVAAGTTAFTTSGITKDGTLASGIAGSGTVSVTVNGSDAKLKAMTLTNDATDIDFITGVNITMRNAADGANIADASATKIKAKITGAGGDAGAAAWIACVNDGGSANDGGFTCALTGHYLTVDSVEISYIP